MKRNAFEQTLDYKNYTCPVQKSALLLGDKWIIFIIREFLYTSEKQRFNHLLRALNPISSRTLSLKLRKLEDDGIITRTLIQERPIKVQYTLTKKGKALKRALKEIGVWYNTFTKTVL